MHIGSTEFATISIKSAGGGLRGISDDLGRRIDIRFALSKRWVDRRARACKFLSKERRIKKRTRDERNTTLPKNQRQRRQRTSDAIDAVAVTLRPIRKRPANPTSARTIIAGARSYL